MCGITGQFNFQRREPVERETIVRMARSIAHRGPDDEGFFIAGPVGLGFRRLSIIDLAGGHQPMSDAKKPSGSSLTARSTTSKSCALNSKQGPSISNQFGHRSDRSRLQGMGHGRFQPSQWHVWSGHLGRAEGAPCRGSRCHGHQTDLLPDRQWPVEVRLGNPPASCSENSRPEVDPVALNLFLRFRYTPSPLTIFQGVRKLAAGTMLVIERGECREQRWYSYTPVPFPSPKEDKEATHELLDLYRAAVRRHLLSDVPVGILLSGGLDSGLLLALMNEQGGPWPAYTIGYGALRR